MKCVGWWREHSILAVPLFLVAGCVTMQTARQRISPTLPEAENISSWPEKYPLAPQQEFGIVELSRTEHSSVHLIQIRHREPLHVHEQHDLIAILLKGHGTLRLGSQTFSVQKGSVVAIPHGVPHAFVNESLEPAAAFAVSSPPLDGPDTVLVQENPPSK